MSEYTPTTDEVIRSFSIPAHRVVERKDRESFADYMSRSSIEGHKSQMESEAAARRWLTEHDAALVEKLAEAIEIDLGWGFTGAEEINAEAAAESWLRARADEIREGEK